MIWKCGDYELETGGKTLVMGILNVTPDSFSDGGEYFGVDEAVRHAKELEADGADIIDIGAQSTRPDSERISADEEWNRLEGVLDALRGELSVPVSVDTFYASVAEKALQRGVSIINDVSGEINRDMAQIVKKTGCGWIIMHNGAGTPDEIRRFFELSAEKCREQGIDGSQLCFDMGIGFGKDYDENMALLANVKSYKPDGFPLLLGTSRKRVIGAATNQPEPLERLYGNIAADTLAVIDGVDIIRLHDVKKERQGIMMADELKKYRKKYG